MLGLACLVKSTQEKTSTPPLCQRTQAKVCKGLLDTKSKLCRSSRKGLKKGYMTIQSLSITNGCTNATMVTFP